jgi:predicted permease
MGDRGHNLIEQLWRDLRHAGLGLLRNPGFSAVAALTLALGIGATTGIFSVVYGVLLKPLPFEAPDRLVAVYHLAPGFSAARNGPQSAATYFTYRDNDRVFEDIGLWSPDEVSIARNGAPERVDALRVTDGFLSLLRVRPLLGDPIRREDDLPGAPDRVVLTHGYWQRTFGGAQNVIGQSLEIDTKPYEIIGVLPASFRFLDTEPQVLLPLRLDPAGAQTGAGFGFRGIGRLKSGVTIEQANDDIARMIPLIAERFPFPPGVTQQMWERIGLAPNVRPLAEDVIGTLGRTLWILLGTVGIVLLMAWTNVANLLLVRGEGRQRELAVRGALGATRGRLISELLSEALTLGLVGGALGVVFALMGLVVLRRMAPAELPRVDEIGVDATVLLFAFTVSVVTALAFGLLPAMKFGTLNFGVLKDAGRSGSDSPGRHRTRNTLVVAQVALALVLLIVSSLMVRTSLILQRVQPGFVRPAEVQTFRLTLPPALIAENEQVVRTHEQIAQRLRQVPGVTAVGLSSSVAMDGGGGSFPVFVADRPGSGTAPPRVTKFIGPGYFETLGNPVVAGRTLTWTDIAQLTPAVVISENLAREYWGEPANALGKRIGGTPAGPWDEIVGVVGAERHEGLNRPAPTLVYRPMADKAFVRRNMAYVVRSERVGSSGFLRELQEAVWSINRNLPLASVQTLKEIQAESMAQTSFAMAMLGLAAVVALVLALVGIYGVVAYIVSQRTHEIGIRMALGAQTGDVRRLFLRHGLVLTLTGIVLGLGAATLLTPLMAALLYGVGPMDPMTYVTVAGMLSAVVLLATYLPARRASRVQPVIALRSRI